ALDGAASDVKRGSIDDRRAVTDSPDLDAPCRERGSATGRGAPPLSAASWYKPYRFRGPSRERGDRPPARLGPASAPVRGRTSGGGTAHERVVSGAHVGGPGAHPRRPGGKRTPHRR